MVNSKVYKLNALPDQNELPNGGGELVLLEDDSDASFSEDDYLVFASDLGSSSNDDDSAHGASADSIPDSEPEADSVSVPDSGPEADSVSIPDSGPEAISDSSESFVEAQAENPLEPEVPMPTATTGSLKPSTSAQAQAVNSNDESIDKKLPSEETSEVQGMEYFYFKMGEFPGEMTGVYRRGRNHSSSSTSSEENVTLKKTCNCKGDPSPGVTPPDIDKPAEQNLLRSSEGQQEPPKLIVSEGKLFETHYDAVPQNILRKAGFFEPARAWLIKLAYALELMTFAFGVVCICWFFLNFHF